MPIVRVSKRSGGVRMRRPMKGRRKMVSYSMTADASRYLKSILNPSFGGAKIPDSFGAKTCTIQLQREVTYKIANNRTGGVLQLSICPIAWTVSSGGYWESPILISGDLGYNGWNDTSIADSDFPPSRLTTLFRSGRVVSGGLKVQYAGTTQNDSGTLTVFSVDRNHLAQRRSVYPGGESNYAAGNPMALDYAVLCSPISASAGNNAVGTGESIRNLPVNAFGPLRLGGTARYFPTDDTDLDFHVYANTTTLSGAGAPTTWGDPTSGAYGVYSPCRTGSVGALGFLVEGGTNDASIIVQYTVNLECTLRDDTFNIVQTSSSPVDPTGLAQAARTYLRKPQVRVGSTMGDTESINVYSR